MGVWTPFSAASSMAVQILTDFSYCPESGALSWCLHPVGVFPMTVCGDLRVEGGDSLVVRSPLGGRPVQYGNYPSRETSVGSRSLATAPSDTSPTPGGISH